VNAEQTPLDDRPPLSLETITTKRGKPVAPSAIDGMVS
jgi:hypothetical protein